MRVTQCNIVCNGIAGMRNGGRPWLVTASAISLGMVNPIQAFSREPAAL